MIRILQALAAPNDERARTYLSDALTWAEPEGYMRVFIDQGSALVPLLRKAIQKGISPDYAGELLQAFLSQTPDPRPAAARADQQTTRPSPEIVEPVSACELEVLQLL